MYFIVLIPVHESDRRSVGDDVVNGGSSGFKEDWKAVFQAASNKVLDDLMLAVDGYALSTRQFAQVNTVAFAAKAYIDPVVNQSFAVDSLGHSQRSQQIYCVLLKNACAESVFHVAAGTEFNDDAIDSGKL